MYYVSCVWKNVLFEWGVQLYSVRISGRRLGVPWGFEAGRMASEKFIERPADILLRMQIIYNACGSFIPAAVDLSKALTIFA